MLTTSLFILVCSTRNRLRLRLRRLREPRYLLGAIAGLAYLYLAFFGRIRGRRAGAARRGGPGPERLAALVAAHQPALLGIGSLVLLGAAALTWLLPFKSGLLEFSQPEVAFLFPAPISRRSLLVHRLVRSQLGLLFGAVIAALIFPSASPLARLQVAATMWLLLVTAKVYFAAVSLARRRLFAREGARPVAAWGAISALGVAVAIAAAALALAFRTGPARGIGAIVDRITAATTTGAAAVVLWPFAALLRPALATSPADLGFALAGAVAVFAAVTIWALEGDDRFRDAAADIAEQRSLGRGGAEPGYAQRLRVWKLPPGGRPEGLFVWKAATQAVRAADKRMLMRLAVVVGAFTASAAALAFARGLAAIVGMFTTIGAVMTVLLGPQILRTDLRQDLLHLEVLRTWPVRPSAVVRGELIWPAVLLTAIAWGFTLLALYLSAPVFGAHALGLRLALAGAAVALAPALIAAQLTVHNAAALMFPAWVPLGTDRPRGLDAFGQRIILLAGVAVILAIGIAPGAVAGGLLWFALERAIGSAAVVLGAAACTVIVFLEVLVATEALGPLYDRIDLVEVERGETA